VALISRLDTLKDFFPVTFPYFQHIPKYDNATQHTDTKHLFSE